MRLTYLRKCVRSDDVRKRVLAVSALDRVLRVSETGSTFAQSQGGVPVERPGRPATWADAWDYQIAAISDLEHLASDDDRDVQSSAIATLVGAVHPLVGTGGRWDALGEVIARTPSLYRELRRELHRLRAVYEESAHVTGISEDAEDRLAAFSALEARLPAPSTHEALVVALSDDLSSWGGRERQLENMVNAMTQFLEDHRQSQLLEFLTQPRLAARLFGTALASLNLEHDALIDALTSAYRINPAALQGYLRAAMEHRDP